MPTLQPPQLQTPRLELRPLRPDDATQLFAIYGDPRVARFLPRAAWHSIAQAEERIARDAQQLVSGEGLRLGLVRRADACLVGDCCLFHFDDQCRRAEIGYSLAVAAWGSGLMHEGLTALIGHGFEALDLNRIEADIDPRNTASARVLERLGFRLEGHLRERWIVEGEVSDSGLYGLLRREWPAPV
jgi:RimJ/RimL family protein N-acetyltransferase